MLCVMPKDKSDAMFIVFVRQSVVERKAQPERGRGRERGNIIVIDVVVANIDTKYFKAWERFGKYHPYLLPPSPKTRHSKLTLRVRCWTRQQCHNRFSVDKYTFDCLKIHFCTRRRRHRRRWWRHQRKRDKLYAKSYLCSFTHFVPTWMTSDWIKQWRWGKSMGNL